jgi:hypothetical protein
MFPQDFFPADFWPIDFWAKTGRKKSYVDLHGAIVSNSPLSSVMAASVANMAALPMRACVVKTAGVEVRALAPPMISVTAKGPRATIAAKRINGEVTE